jgi:hypothetical protein
MGRHIALQDQGHVIAIRQGAAVEGEDSEGGVVGVNVLQRTEQGVNDALAQERQAAHWILQSRCTGPPASGDGAARTIGKPMARLQPQPGFPFQPCPLVHPPFHLQQSGVATNAPTSSLFFNREPKGLRAFALIAADGGLMLLQGDAHLLT